MFICRALLSLTALRFAKQKWFSMLCNAPSHGSSVDVRIPCSEVPGTLCFTEEHKQSIKQLSL